ncbi:transcriptional regulator [Sphaerisporangium siamense]|uniref:DNA-binding GntR family transcriptional regulator n=1 Tax=Sphaerisporangium siamense TaxID=795645 RepID=A0A7W7GCJ8_9ACTN|nr:GntR family transcriptional regulator [Sphaerisporangium siamense]MBB4702071.1 DNA-binding GntR family transcriptional regulator [Sphaerisporangium siamense]GII87238.1 transcriptional regulator [Sphaerisporangium siamense]
MSAQDLAGRAAAHKIARPVPLRESVHEALLELIIRRTVRPGEHLAESELAEMLGVSRQPVREALQHLSREGWVDLHPGHGAFVHVPTFAEADQLLAVRCLLETEAARLAARHRTDEAVARLRERCARGLAAIHAGDNDAVVALNFELHGIVMELAGNAVLTDLAAQVSRRVRWFQSPVALQRGVLAWKEHAELVDALDRGDAEGAAEVMKRHTDHTREMYLRRLAEEEPVRPEAERRRPRRTPATSGR